MPGQQKSKHLKTESGKCFNFRAFFILLFKITRVQIVKSLFTLYLIRENISDNFWRENTKPIFSLLIPTFRYPDLKKHDNFS